MTNVNKALELRKNLFNGRVASIDEMRLLEDVFPDFRDILNVLLQYKIIGQTFKLNSKQDVSGLGVAMEWLSPAAQIEEASKFYPGIVVRNEGYLPVGSCLFGSGDPYFIKVGATGWDLFRVLHDVSTDTYVPEMAELISPLQDLFYR